jgi:Tfp pilus assembly protein PilW
MHRLILHSRAKAFTFVELMLGIVVTSIVLAALGGFTTSVGQYWRTSDSAQSAFLAADMGVDRLNMLVRSAQMIGSAVANGSLDNSAPAASCMLWTDDNVDGKIQYSEITLLQFDPVNQRLVEYTIAPTATNATTQVASLMSAATFLSLPNVTATAIVHELGACEIYSVNSAAGVRPSLEFVLQMQTSDKSSASLVYMTAALRGPGNPI